jgi:hypothetical protein
VNSRGNLGYDHSKPFSIDNHENPRENHPPNKPNKPSGETSGKTGIEYTYATSTTDPDGDQVYYMWSWGDGTNSGWLGPYNSGETAEATHVWDEEGEYKIKVRAKDIHGEVSSWSDSLSISMPKSKAVNLLLLFQENIRYHLQLKSRDLHGSHLKQTN